MNQCPFANLLNPDTYAQGMPYTRLKEIRDAGPVVKIEDPISGTPYWAVTRIAEMDEVSKNPALFYSAERSAFPMEYGDDIVEMQRLTIINMDPPQHQKARRIVRNAFTPKRVESYAARFREHARLIVDAVADRGECEFVEEVAAELPLIAILELLGVPLDDRKQFFDWTNTMIFADDPDMATSMEEGQLAAMEVITYALDIAAKHRQSPMDNITAALLDAELGGEPITEEMFGWMFILILVGGNESTRTVIAQGMRLLMEHPAQLQYLIDNPEKLAMPAKKYCATTPRLSACDAQPWQTQSWADSTSRRETRLSSTITPPITMSTSSVRTPWRSTSRALNVCQIFIVSFAPSELANIFVLAPTWRDSS